MNDQFYDELLIYLKRIAENAKLVKDHDVSVSITGDIINIACVLNTFEKAEDEEMKKNCINFYYWWHNQSGTNTEQGYEEWIKLDKEKEQA